MIADHIFLIKDHPVIDRGDSKLIDKSKIIMKVVVSAENEKGEEVRCTEEKEFPSESCQIEVLADLLYKISVKIKPKKQ